MVTIINYGLGNIGSILNLFKKIEIKAIETSDPEIILKAEKLLLPGVGAFDAGMNNLNNSGMLEAINTKVINQKIPILGVCLGMQMLCKSSEEGKEKGLGWIDADVLKFNFSESLSLKVPHMGWNFVYSKKEHSLIKNLPLNPRYYFVHSYYVKCANEENVLLTSNYGFDFTCALAHDNIMGVQFHPEKSHKYGFQLLKNFSKL